LGASAVASSTVLDLSSQQSADQATAAWRHGV